MSFRSFLKPIFRNSLHSNIPHTFAPRPTLENLDTHQER